MGNIIPLHGDPHEQTQQLLPWLVNGTLDGAERRMADEHLASCAECRADLAREERLAEMLASAPPAEPEGWAVLRNRALSASKPSRPVRRLPVSGAGRFAAIAASQLLVIGATVGAYHLVSKPAQPPYRVLGASGGTTQGNLIVIFQPDTTELAMRDALHIAGARIVDGPTSASAYVLAVAPARRNEALDALRRRSDIVMAQPIDGASLP